MAAWSMLARLARVFVPVLLTSRRLRAAAVLVLVLLSPGRCPATDLTAYKLFGRWVDTTPSANMGSGLSNAVVTARRVVMGAFRAAERGVDDEGAVQVFDAVSGAWQRKILPPAGGGAQFFGSAVAVSGDVAVIGAYGYSGNQGAAYVVNLATGAILKTLIANDGAASDFLGLSVAIAGNIAVVGTDLDDGGRGAAYLFDITTGLQIGKLQAADGVGGDNFGFALAAEGSLLAVSAPKHDSQRGTIYLYDLRSQALVQEFTPTGAAINDHAGHSLGLSGGRLMIGTEGVGKAFFADLANSVQRQITLPGGPPTSYYGYGVAIDGELIAVGEYTAASNRGAVHLFRVSDGAFLRTLIPPNGEASGNGFGQAVSLCGEALLVAAPQDGQQYFLAGAGYLFRPVTTALPYTLVAVKGNVAPGEADISFGAFKETYINSDAQVMLGAGLTGYASNGGRDVGVFSDKVTLGNLLLCMKTHDAFGSLPTQYGAPLRWSNNGDGMVLMHTTITGPGISTLNNQVLLGQTGLNGFVILRSGQALPGFPGTWVQSIVEPVSADGQFSRQSATLCTLRLGQGGTTAINDMALLSDRNGADEVLREGASPAGLPASTALGQFAPRLACNTVTEVFSTALTGTAPAVTTANNALVLYRLPGISAVNVLAQKGDTPKDPLTSPLTGAKYSAFIGEGGGSDTQGAIFRATLAAAGTGTPPAVTVANNEGLWVHAGSPVGTYLALRKGQAVPLPGTTGLKVGRIVQFWVFGYTSTTSQIVALVQLTGPGVTAANDQALLHVSIDRSIEVLLREGEAAPGCPGTRIGVITRVAAEAFTFSYAVTATLTGATPTTDLALYTGAVSRGLNSITAPLRRPFLRLRKGQLFDNQPGRVRSIVLPASTVTASGAGGTGRGRPISWRGDFAFQVDFDNGASELFRGKVN